MGDALQVTACGTWAAYTLISAGAVKRNGALVVTTFAMGVAALVVAAATPWSGWLQGELTARAVGAAAFLGVVCSALAMWLWLCAVTADGAAKAAAMLYFEPFFTLTAAVLVLSEPILVQALVGGAGRAARSLAGRTRLAGAG